MRTIDLWLSEYRENHQHPKNRAIHFISTPLIMLGIMGIVWSLSLPVLAMLIVVYLAFFFVLSKPMFLGILFLVGLEVLAVYWMNQRVQIPLYLVSIVILIIGWLFQFLGHSIERKRAKISRSIIMLLIGPAYLLAPIYRLFGIKL